MACLPLPLAPWLDRFGTCRVVGGTRVLVHLIMCLLFFFFNLILSFLFKAVPVILSLVPQTSFAVVLVEGLVAGLPMERLPVKQLPGTIRETHSMGNSFYFCRENNAGERGQGLLPVCIGKSLKQEGGKC